MNKPIAERFIAWRLEGRENTEHNRNMFLSEVSMRIYGWLEGQVENQPRSETYTVRYEAAPSPSINTNLPNSRTFTLTEVEAIARDAAEWGNKWNDPEFVKNRFEGDFWEPTLKEMSK